MPASRKLESNHRAQLSRRTFLFGASAFGLLSGVTGHTAASDLGALASRFLLPPDDCRPMARWWWFGGAVEPIELVREITAMKAGGFGGFELQPVYPLSLDAPALGIRNKAFLSAPFLEDVALAARAARAQGLRADVTLGSGWPFGGPHITPELASSRIVALELPSPAGSTSVELPPLGQGERNLAAFVGTAARDATAAELTRTHATFRKAETSRTVYLIRQTRTRQQVKRSTVGAEGLVLDHLSVEAVRMHLRAVGEPLLKAFGENAPHAIFSDSLEVYGANWTDDLLIEFESRRGYDLTSHLMSLFHESDAAAAVRYDWSLTLSELLEERYLSQVRLWAKAHRTLFRSQTYGIPAVRLSSSRLADLAEGEGAEWRRATSTRWASSTNHLYGRSVTSAESFTWIHRGAFRATPLDIKAEADALLLQGANHFIAHGWPYSPPAIPEPGWAFYAAGVFNDHNPWWPVMADVNGYLQRLSWLLRQGDNIADVAIYVPTEDLMSSFHPGKNISINDELHKSFPQAVLNTIIDAGFNFDLIDGDAILAHGVAHRLLILPHIVRIEPEVYERICAFAREGGSVVSIGPPPFLAPGRNDASTRSRRVAAQSSSLFNRGQSNARIVDESEFAEALARLLTPDLKNAPLGLGFVHRRLKEADVYFIANTSNQTVTAHLAFRAGSGPGQTWDPVTCAIGSFRPGEAVTLAPFESRVFIFGQAQPPMARPVTRTVRSSTLAEGWTLALGADASARPVHAFDSWTNLPEQRHFSGAGIYRRNVHLSNEDLTCSSIELDLGEGQPRDSDHSDKPGYVAAYDAPVRDAAEVFVNGRRAGAIWCAPFRINLKPLLMPGSNELKVRVYNTAINSLAGQQPPDYVALKQAYGDRFQPQNMTNLQPLPSGLLQPPRLMFAQT